MADSVRAAAQRGYLSRTWAESVRPVRMERRSGDEVAAEVINRLGLEVR